MVERLTSSGENALALLASSPSLLTKVGALIHEAPGGRRVEWDKIAQLAATDGLWSAADRAFLGICAEVAGYTPEGRNDPDAFGARWDALDGQHQAMIASVLTASAQGKKAEERAIYERLGVPWPDPVLVSNRGIRVRLGPDIPAVSNDGLGRERVGWREGLSVHEEWLRGRGVWRMQADRVVTSQRLLIASGGLVRMVGTIDGVTIHGDRLAIIGRPLPDHPLIGKPDPLDNNSQNPVAYGEIEDLV